MLIKSVGTAILGFMTGTLFTKNHPILGALVLIGTFCMLVGSWLEVNKVIKEIENIRQELNAKIR